ncbi:MAG TPA: hypothetical protein VJ810_42185 [Blastocatellia bacterium]|nr:hypothetical protein [Blastocatellia bacterium]
MNTDLMPQIVELSLYLPILTTVISATFAWVILARYRLKPQSYHLLWWGIGIATYGVGTLIESLVTLFGWQAALFKAWYIAGALLGGAPLAIGTIYLLFGLRAGRVAAVSLGAVVAVTSIFVILSPLRMEVVDPKLLSGNALAWQSIRRVSPFINSLAALFLIGGAVYSAIRFFSYPESRHVSIGNIFIAIGAILPGIGGMGSRMGHTELLYIGEFIGVILIWIGYKYCQQPFDAINPDAMARK